MILRTLLMTLMLALLGVVALAPTSSAAACSSDLNPTDDNGVSATCAVPNGGGRTCTVGAGAYGDPRPYVGCNPELPPIIVCVTEPCP